MKGSTDFQNRKRAEATLRARESELSQIINTIPALVWSAGPDGAAEFFNQHYIAYVGLPLEQLQGRGWTVAVHPDDLSALAATWQSMMAAGKPGEAEARLRRFDGEYRWFLFRTNPMRDDSGSIIKWFGINTDIEDRKRAEEALALNERELRSIINTIPTLAWSTGPDGSADFVNQRLLDYTGLSAERAQGWGWGAAIHPDDVKALVEYWQSCLASGTPVEAEARMRRFDGAYRWFLFRANPLRDEAGNIAKWYGTNIDIEDRRRVEEALRASELSWRQIVDNIPGLVATMGARGEVEFLNRQTLEYFGKTNEELENWALIGAVHPDDLPRVIEARTKSIEAEQI
jgi:PAS domain S-box-containing protein